ncbi:hypothetical protein BMS3Bbin04_00178 [bacterium BMS3Bbin04]|nr:hypothetical protein BMS3Bbin04_00178 [bacterium BMS3Bbin04]
MSDAKNEEWQLMHGPMIPEGDWDYGLTHAAFHNVSMPADTYTFCVLRDLAARVLSHYKMLLHMWEHEPNNTSP